MKRFGFQKVNKLLPLVLLLFSSCSTSINSTEPLSEDPAAKKLYSKGTILMQASRYKEALPLLNEAIEHDSHFVAALVNRAHTHGGLLEYKEALDDANSAVRLNPQSSFAWQEKAKAEEGLGKYLDAAASYEEAAKYNSTSTYESLRLSAKCLNLGGQPIKAKELSDRLETATDANICLGRGMSKYYQGQYALAIKDLSQAIGKDEKLANAYFQRGNCFTRLGQFQQALDDYNKAISLDKGFVEAYYSRGLDEFCLGEYSGAAEDFRHHATINGVGSYHSTYDVIFAALAYRKVHQKDYSNALLQWWEKSNNDPAWPMPVVNFLLGKISADKLETMADTDSLKTLTKTYLGIVASIDNKKDDAIKELSWVKEHGNKSLAEYQIAVLELEKVTKAAPEHQTKASLRR